MSSSQTPLLDPGLLIEAVQAISISRSTAEIMRIVQTTARKGAQADGATFVLRDGEECFYADEDAVSPLWKGKRFPMEQCISGWAMIHGRVAVIPDITVDERIPQDAYRPTFVRSLVMTPIRTRDPLGAIGVYWSDKRQASDLMVEWLQALANAASAGLEAANAQGEALRWRNQSQLKDNGGNFVRMCAWTRRLWHQGEWLPVEAFLQARFGITTTHGMSEEAMDVFMKNAEALQSATVQAAEKAEAGDSRPLRPDGASAGAARARR